MSKSVHPIRNEHQSSAPAASIAPDVDRCHGLDWLRGIAALLVVALHAGIAYTLKPFPGLAWPTHDPHPSPFVDGMTWWIDGFIMPLFLLLGGFVAAQLFLKRGPDGFLQHRARRLLVPLLFGCVVILPLDLYVWLLGWAAEGKIPLKKLRSLKLGTAGEGLWGIGHLWFLEYLFLFCAAAWALHRIAAWWTARRIANGRHAIITRSVSEGLGRRHDSAPRLRFGLRWRTRRGESATSNSVSEGPARFALGVSFWLPFLLALPSALALWWEPRIVIGFRHSWHPLPANLLYFAPCFAGGWWLYHRYRAGKPLTRSAPWHLALSIVCFAALLPLIRAHVAAEFSGPRRVMLAALFACFAWLSAAGWFGLCLGRMGPPPRAVRYLSDASFWMYLFHHPVVGLAQVALAGSALPAATKFVIVTATGIGLSLLTFQVGVRFTWVGQLLNGRRDSRSGAAPSAIQGNEVAHDAPLRRAA